MWLLRTIFCFVLVQVISCIPYDQLAKDECFKKVYVCGDHRSSVTGGTGRLATEPYRFSEICRNNKEFIACIEQAADFCTDKFTNLSRIALDNRRHLKLFCTDFQWKKNYFSSAQCINDNEKKVTDICVKEEDEYKDDRPQWCLIPEPCEALERVFFCTVRKMKQLCGAVAAEVHRRMHLLKLRDRDVVCEIRQQNPLYCRYQRQRPSQEEFAKRVGTLSVTLSKAINNVFESALVDTMDQFALLLNEENISDLFETDEYKLRKAIFKTEVEEKFGAFFKKCKLPKSEWSRQPDMSPKIFNSLFGNIKKIILEASSKFGSSFYENTLKFCGTDNLFLENCIEKLNELGVLNTETQELNAELKSLKDYIIELFEFLSCREDFLIKSIGEDEALISWDNVDNFPLQTLSCEWKENVQVFQCSFKLKQSVLTQEDTPGIKESTSENVKILKPFNLESSLFTGFGSGMMGELLASTDEGLALDSSTPDAPEVDVFDIHRSGEQILLPEEMYSEVLNQVYDESKKDALNKNCNKENSMEETYFLVNSQHEPADSASCLVVDAATNREKAHPDSLQKSTFHQNSELSDAEVDIHETSLEKEYIDLQTRKIMDVLNEIFEDVVVKILNSKEGSETLDWKSEREDPPYSFSYFMNKKFQTELQHFLKERMNEFIEMYLIHTNFPIQGERHGVRDKREVVTERQNSKFEKNFNVEPLNESARTNSKYMNFKTEL